VENYAKVTILRFDPTVDHEPRHEHYEIPYEHWHGVKVIDTIRWVYENLDPGLSFREPCRQQICGACTLLMNKKVILACDTFSEQEMVIEPLSGRVILKDLVAELPADSK
jgi:succinate dehydrogenase/fumarate reductase iron-sulfur protein